MKDMIKILTYVANIFDELCPCYGKCSNCRGCEDLIEGYSIADFLKAVQHIDDKEYIKQKIEQRK